MIRRDFLKTAGSGALGLMASGYPFRSVAAEPNGDSIRAFLVWQDTAVIELTEKVYQQSTCHNIEIELI